MEEGIVGVAWKESLWAMGVDMWEEQGLRMIRMIIMRQVVVHKLMEEVGNGANGSFGQGGGNGGYCSGGGGGGWFGGGAPAYLDYSDRVSGGGGSGYFARDIEEGCMYCYKALMTTNNAATKTVSTNSVSQTPRSEYAKQGNGYARITLVE